MKKVIVFSLLALSILGFSSLQSPARAGECSGASWGDAENAIASQPNMGRWEGFEDDYEATNYTGGSVSQNYDGENFIRQRPGC